MRASLASMAGQRMRSSLAVLLCSAAQPMVTIREMQAADIPTVSRLLCDAFEPPSGYNLLQRQIVMIETESGLTDRLGKSSLLVAENQNAVIVGSVEVFTPAFLVGKNVRFWNQSLPLDSYISALAISADWRRQGIAQALLASVEGRAWQAGDRFVSLQVDSINAAAIALYKGRGYDVVGYDSAVTAPSKNAMISNIAFGGAKLRSLIVLQKSAPATPTTQVEESRLGRLLKRGRGMISRISFFKRARSLGTRSSDLS